MFLLCGWVVILILGTGGVGMGFKNELSGVGSIGGNGVIGHDKCQPMEIFVCQEMPYKSTIFPNLMGNLDQKDAAYDLRNYQPLIKVTCSPDIHKFLCSMFAPVCTILPHPIPPCRELCLSAKNGCEETMNKFSYPWPRAFDCDKFPKYGTDLCIDNNQRKFDPADIEKYQSSSTPPSSIGSDQNSHNSEMDFVCPAQLSVPSDKEYVLRVGHQEVENCGAPCYSMFFDENQISFSRQWIGLWSILSLLSCTFTLLTFLADTGRFAYPERPIIYLCLCYFMISLAYIIGYANNNDDIIACNEPFPAKAINLKMERTIKQGTLNDEWRCTLLAMILYFFTLSANIWWVILTITWFLSAGLKWGQEAIDVKSQWFHTVAWVIPSFMTIAVLIMKKIDGDVLSGVCYVGLWDVESLRYYVLAPLFLCLVVGTIFLILGFSSLVKIRTIMKQDGGKTDKLERLMARIGTFSTLYTIPSIVVAGCYFYEQNYFRDWMVQWQEKTCRDPDLSIIWQIPCRYNDGEGPNVPYPEFTVFMIKYLMILMVGVFSGFWVWSGKTIVTWKNFWGRLSGKGRDEAYV